MSAEEYFTFTTEESEKLEVQRLAEELDGNLELAIRRMAERKREEQRQVSTQKRAMRNKSLMRLAVCLIGMAAMVLQGCSEGGTDRDKLCGSWSSVEGKPDVLVYKEGEATR